MFNFNDLVELHRWERQNRKWYVKLWEDYLAPLVFVIIVFGGPALIGYLIGKYT